MLTVPAHGPSPCRVLLVGEAPGKGEAFAKPPRPFVGKSGKELEWYFGLSSLTGHLYRKANVVQEYREGNPDPTPEQIAYWSPKLEAEVASTRPDVVVPIGRFASRWFLGEYVDMEMIHGLPHYAGEFDSSRKDRAGGALVVPVFHPAMGLHSGDARSLIAWDFEQLCRILKSIDDLDSIYIPRDEYIGQERYLDVSGQFLADVCRQARVVGLDTEGRLPNYWSIQVSCRSGSGLVLRSTADHFAVGIAALQRLADTGCVFVIHNAMYDLAVCRAMGLDLFRARIFDTMYAAYLLRVEPQSLKRLVWRWCRMKMESYSDTLGDAEKEQQLEYLGRVEAMSWSKPEPRVVTANDGTSKLYKPQGIKQRVGKILTDFDNDKRDKDGNVVDLRKRWKGIDKGLRYEVEQLMGGIPYATLDDIPLKRSIGYSGRDPDGTLRLLAPMVYELARLGLTEANSWL